MSGVTASTVLIGATLAATAVSTANSMGAFGRPGGGGGGATPSLGAPPAAPTYEDPSVAAAAALQNSAAANAKGRASTILTSGLGDRSPVTTNKKQLLGA